MTVKELRAKLSTVPEDAQVEMLMCQNDNPVEEACRVDKMVYFQLPLVSLVNNLGFLQ